MKNKILVSSLLLTTLCLTSCFGGVDNKTPTDTKTSTEADLATWKDITITAVTDSSHFKDSQDISLFIAQFKTAHPYIKDANVIVKDYQKEKSEVQKIMKDMNKTSLPIILIDKDTFTETGENKFKSYLQKATVNGKETFYLEIGEVYNPETKEALDPNITTNKINDVDAKLINDYDKIYLQKTNSKITFFIASDFDCPYCKKAEAEGETDKLLQGLAKDHNVVFLNLPLTEIHVNAEAKAVQFLKKIEGKDTETIKKEIRKMYEDQTTSILKVDETKDKKYLDKVRLEASIASKFKAFGTPSVIVYNSETKETVQFPLSYTNDVVAKKVGNLIK